VTARKRAGFCLFLSSVLAVGLVGAGDVAAAPSSVVVTAAQLCAQTKQSVQTSPRYVVLSARQRQAVDALANVACAALTSISPRLSASQKAKLITTYQAWVTALAQGGWLSASDATTLKALVNQLDDLRPVAVITGPTTATVGVQVAFDGVLSGDPDGTVASYAWSWGDGTPDGNGVAPTHTFTTYGSYTVTLVVTDNKGASSDPVTLGVLVNARPTAVIDDPGVGGVGVALFFSGESSSDPDGAVASYDWSWGDGSPDGSEATPSHTYSVASTYTVTLVVTDDKGASSDPVSLQVEVKDATSTGRCSDPRIALNDASGNPIASAVVLPSPTLEPCALFQVVPETHSGFPEASPASQVDAAELFGPGSTAIANSPVGYDRISDAVQFTGNIGANKVRVCFSLPSNYTAYKTNRIAYYDTTPAINRWVFLTTSVNSANKQACMTKGLFKPSPPVVFGLFGLN
jgi:PKD repeat protein